LGWLALIMLFVAAVVGSQQARANTGANTGAGACDLDFDNDGIVGPLDLEAFTCVFSEGECPNAGGSSHFDTIDFNGDGSVYDPADLDAFRLAHSGGPCPSGWYPSPKFAGAAWIYWSQSRGDDANPGTRELPVASQERLYLLIQDARVRGLPAAAILFRGETYSQALLGQYNAWAWGGTNQEPLYIMADPQMDASLERPIIELASGGNGFKAYAGNIRLLGLQLHNTSVNPQTRGDGITFYGKGENGVGNIVIDDCSVTGFGGNLKIQKDELALDPIRNVVVSRSSIVGAWSNNGHSQGVFFSGLNGARVRECVLFANGYNLARGDAPPTTMNHNYYGVPNNQDVVFENVITTQASATGLQLRGWDQWARECVAINNPLGITGGHAQALPDQDWVGGIEGCLILGGGDIGATRRSFSLGINRTNQTKPARVVGNIIWRAGPECLAMDAGMVFWLQGATRQGWTISGNTVYEPRWNGTAAVAEPAIRDDRQSGSLPLAADIFASNQFLASPAPHWQRTPGLVDYLNSHGVNVFSPDMAGSAFTASAASNRRGAWNQAWTARNLLGYWRESMMPPAPHAPPASAK
jgi:hypothetical protein